MNFYKKYVLFLVLGLPIIIYACWGDVIFAFMICVFYSVLSLWYLTGS